MLGVVPTILKLFSKLEEHLTKSGQVSQQCHQHHSEYCVSNQRFTMLLDSRLMRSHVVNHHFHCIYLHHHYYALANYFRNN